MARSVMDQLLRYGEINRGRIGVAIQDLTPDLAQAMNTTRTVGAVISKVIPGSPADHAGLKSGDLVVAVNGVAIRDGAQLRNTIGLSRIGDQVRLAVDRGGSERTVDIRVEAAPEQTPASKQAPER
jgi:S1-C subfamily serine protease